MAKETNDIEFTENIDDVDSIFTENEHKITPRTDILKHRSNIKEILLNSNATPIRGYGGIGYTCSYCQNQYPKPADLKKHTLEVHKNISEANFMKTMNMSEYVVKVDITALQCRICNKDMDTLNKLIEHLQLVHEKEIYKDHNNHIFPFKFINDSLICTICSNAFSKFRTLIRHMHVHYRNYICIVCDSGFVNRNALTQHSVNHRTGTFNCYYCPKICSTITKKRRHERTAHTHIDLANKCGYCKETFKDYRKKEAHLALAHRVVTITPICQACDKVFNSRKALNIHIKRDHLMERLHKCPECEMQFYSTTGLKNHMVKHTGIREHQCSVCLKSYGRKKTLNAHMKIHECEKRFKCEYCAHEYAQKWSWRSHMRSKHEVIV